jgi:hypothetical protein
LSTDRVEQAWPLVREIATGISFESWCAYARAMLSPIDPERDIRGILVVQRKRTIRGLVTYETINDLTHGRMLLLRNAVVMDLALRETIAASLHARSMDIARQTACGSLYLEVAPQMAWIGDIWKKLVGVDGGLPVRVVAIPSPTAAPKLEDRSIPVRSGA